MANHSVTVVCLHTSPLLKADAQLLGEVTLGGRATELPLNQKTNEAVKPQVNFEITYFPSVILDLRGENTKQPQGKGDPAADPAVSVLEWLMPRGFRFAATMTASPGLPRGSCLE